ncbi:BN159_2729 family protein [Streptomyces sp. DSM 42041]|uniref:BN159_2729 family protein n=1 Tax=Streptomyces hazeniae TaxID=3075538 RepID=A0ABU2NK00_9ACTN|nr:BN159_2729 family protein [Streptomyces sp. DSM 42041]MDT0377315.1 BN159_2729 family protein [Streptomyces sp. DSM 42041]
MTTLNANIKHADMLVRLNLHRHLDGVVRRVDLDVISANIARDLDEAGMLTDPERSYGPVLQRDEGGRWATSDGGASAAAPAPPAGAPEMPAALEREAALWVHKCQAAATIAARLRAGCKDRPEVMGIQSAQDTVVVTLNITALADFETWVQYVAGDRLGARNLRYAMRVVGHLEDVPVRLIGHGVPDLLDAATRRHEPEPVSLEDFEPSSPPAPPVDEAPAVEETQPAPAPARGEDEGDSFPAADATVGGGQA